MKNILLFTALLIAALGCISKTGEGSTDVIEEEAISEQNMQLPSIFNVNNFSLTMNEAMTELFTTSIDEHGDMSIVWSKKTGEQWSDFSPVSFSEHAYNDIDPFLSRDGASLYFISNRDNGMFEGDNAIWVSNREGDDWSTPELLSEAINFEGNEGFPSVAANGNIYFPMVKDENRDIYISTYENGEYTAPVNLGEAINSSESDSNPAISGDEKVLVFYSAREGGYGASDLYLCRKVDGEWTSAINMGAEVNSPQIEYCPYITHDSKYLFYTRWNREKDIRIMMQVRLDTLMIME